MKNENLLNETNKVSIRIAYAYDSKAPAHWSQGVVGRYDVYSAYYGESQEIYRCDKVSADQKLLDEIWAGWNNGSGEECDAFRGANARSLSVGDYVEITFRDRVDYYRVESTGWNHVNWSAFQAEVDAYEASDEWRTSLSDADYAIVRKAEKEYSLGEDGDCDNYCNWS